MKHRMLVVDDEKNTREGLKWSLEDAGYEVLTAADGQEALEIFHAEPLDLVITDLKMPGLDGLELLKRIKQDEPQVAVIMLTAHGSIENAVEAMAAGAAYYQTKPVDLDELRVKCEQSLGNRRMALENEQLRTLVNRRYGFENIIGNSPAMEQVFHTVRQVAPSRATVLIHGESGTGKELIAHAIHLNSPRAAKPFVPVNCGALSTSLLESELFGHEKGAFTHAVKTKPGRFELADGGTIFLDEISETAPEFQVKLLRVLQEQTFERVGGVDPIKVDVRVIAATNRDARQLVEEGRMRTDLYYRLNVVQIHVPPLRRRPEDIPLLVNAFLTEFREANGRGPHHVVPAAMARLQQFHWPGNVRQLRNVIEGLVVMSTDDTIEPADLPPEIAGAAPRPDGTPPPAPGDGKHIVLPVGSTFEDAERELIRATLAHEHGNRAQTARTLGIGRKTLYRKMEEYGISS